MNPPSQSDSVVSAIIRSSFARSTLTATKRSRVRRAVAAAEFAVCMPVILLLVFGSIEATCFIFLKQSLQIAAHEAIREASRSTATEAQATARALAILESRQVQGATIRYPDGDIANIARGEPVTIEVSASTRANSPLAGQWVANRDLTARVYMLKE